MLAEFLFAAELAKLEALALVSDNFETPLFNEANDLEADALDRLFDQYDAVVVFRDEVLGTLDLIEAEVAVFEGTAARPERWVGVASSGQGIAATRRAPTTGVFESIKDTLLGFFGYAGNAGTRASLDILAVAADMTPDERNDAFLDIPLNLLDGASSFQELSQRLTEGELSNNAAQIRAKLWGNANFSIAAQSVCNCNSPSLFTAHREGAELVTRGAELQVDVVKTVLGDVFPDISRGFDMADKANEWAEYLSEVYTDALGTLEAESRDAAKEEISDRIKAALAECCPELASVADEIADRLSEDAVDSVPELALLVRSAAGTSNPTVAPAPGAATPRPTGTRRPGVTSPVATATPAATPALTPTPTAATTPTATRTPEATGTPEPGASATVTATSEPTPCPTETPGPGPTGTPAPIVTSTPIPPPGYVIWRVTNYAAAGGYIFAGLEDLDDNPSLLSILPGGGIRSSVQQLSAVTGPFPTIGAARASVCIDITGYSRPPLASFILNATFQGQTVGIEEPFLAACPQ